MGQQKTMISLQGTWQFQLDSLKIGESEQWYNRNLPANIQLPGSVDEGGFGKAHVNGTPLYDGQPEIYRLARKHVYIGAAWFRKEITLAPDWRIDLNSAERMSVALKKSGRDILFSLSNSAPFENAKDWARVSNAWRTGPDIRDSWLSLYTSAFTIDKWAPFAGPGHWNDPDMLILGNVTTGTELHPTRLTPDEQYSHVSLFSLLAAPLLIGCPIEQLDAFTLNLITNDEVIEVNQDPLGRPARLMADENGVQIWIKRMEDGSYAVGLFNIAQYGKKPQS
jgi:hypothetical protein